MPAGILPHFPALIIQNGILHRQENTANDVQFIFLSFCIIMNQQQTAPLLFMQIKRAQFPVLLKDTYLSYAPCSCFNIASFPTVAILACSRTDLKISAAAP